MTVLDLIGHFDRRKAIVKPRRRPSCSARPGISGVWGLGEMFTVRSGQVAVPRLGSADGGSVTTVSPSAASAES